MTKEEYFYVGLKAYNNKNYDEAIDYFNLLIDAFSNSIGEEKLSETYYMRGICYAQEYSIDEALEDFNEAEKLGFDKSKIYCGIGIAYAHDGNNKEAISNFTKAIELNKIYDEAYYRRGIAYNFMLDFNRAIIDFNKAIELDANFNPAYNNRGLVYYRMGKEKYDEAFNDFDKAIKLNYKLTVAYNNRGLIYFHKKDYDNAFDDLKKFKLDDTLNYMIKICLICKIDINKIENLPIKYVDSYFRSIVKNITTENKNKLFKIWIYQYILLDLLSIKNYKNIKELSHYTSKNIFEKLINNDEENCNAYLRFTSISKANDPKEGEILKNCYQKI